MANFSPVSLAKISPRLPEQIFLKRLHEESFSQVKRAEKPHLIAFKFQPGLKYERRYAHRLSCECKTLSNRRFPPSLKHCARAEIHHVIARKFEGSGRTEISARAEIRHVIGPLIWSFTL